MKRSIQSLLYFLSAVLLLSACSKKDEIFDRPPGLADPIYQQLQSRGNFTNFLALVDKAGYKEILSTGGYWTMFAPTDDAFTKFFQESNISGVADIPDSTAAKIVKYSLVYNANRRAQLPNYQSPAGVLPNMAYKRETAYYDWVKSNGKRKYIAANRNGITPVANDNNNKHIPYFTDEYFTAKNLNGATEYNYFFPNTTFTGFNVIDAKVLEQDIVAENGIIHTVDKVLLPLPSLESYLASKPEYSKFRELFEKHMVRYVYSADITRRNQVLTGSADSVFYKMYSGVAFAINNENYAVGNTDSQIEGFTIAIPTNNVVDAYVAEILKHYGTFEAAPPSVISSFLNAHMWGSTIWKGRLNNALNVQQEPPTFSATNIVDKKVVSNGIFYGIDKVQDANVFRSVYGKAFLNPNYTLMTRGLDAELRFSILNPTSNYTLVMMSNQNLNKEGYDFNTDRNQWSFTRPGGTATIDESSRNRFMRLLQNSVFLTPNGEMNNLGGFGMVEAWNGEYVKFKDNKLWASGNEEINKAVNVTSQETAHNGKVYYTDGILTFSEKTIGHHLDSLARIDPNTYGHFFSYLKNHRTMWIPAVAPATGGSILGANTGAFHTIFVPTNAAIVNAVKAGILPGNTSTGQPNFTPANASADSEKIERFIQYHIINKNTVVPDGKKFGAFETLLKNGSGDPVFITVNNGINSMELVGAVDPATNRANLNADINKSNVLSNKTVIHSIDKVLKF
ncbi:fasciclin domain-containing protein [Pedobacter sp. SYSU D00535]|uniref:fasciclin domain-containing protein n=1 Tax=Pedobacter sp. SYSU D00535 TaxID=2810308 RepID=UPI001A974C52|nr:fasciclin domain-containing protein [Pedobacter sp. SYSU D00535]